MADSLTANTFTAGSCMRALLGAIVILLAPPCYAVTTEADISVGMKTLPLLTSKIEGSATVAIIFDPADASSKDEAASINAILGRGFVAPGDLKLTRRLVPVNDLPRIEGSKIALLTSGLSAHYDAIGSVAANNGILTMSTDLGCVKANKCVLGIVSKPHVEIYYSKVAADAAKISFEQVFTLLSKQI